jgi:hypothetical protein
MFTIPSSARQQKFLFLRGADSKNVFSFVFIHANCAFTEEQKPRFGVIVVRSYFFNPLPFKPTENNCDPTQQLTSVRSKNVLVSAVKS